MAFEGVTLDICGTNLIFTSGLTEKVLLTRNIKDFTTQDDLIVLIQELDKRTWFTQEMRYKIEREVIRFLHEF
jgi:DNA-binding ferritin-like protein